MVQQAVVLAAGLGTRLRPLTNQLAKPLVPVGDRPLLQHIMEGLQRAGVQRISLNAHHLAPQVTDFAQLLSTPGVHIECVVERALLGTAGGVRRLAHGACEPVLVWNGDIFAPDLLPDTAFFARAALCAPSLVVAPASGTGTVGLDASGNVVRVRGERFGRETSAADYIGIALLPPAFVARLPTEGCLVAGALLPWLRAGRTVHSIAFDRFWSDAGTLSQYLAMNLHWLRARNLAAFQAETAEVSAAVDLQASIVGAGAVVDGSGVLSRCVVWPGARAVAPLRDTIVLTDGTKVSAISD